MREFIKSSFNRQEREDRQMIKTRIAVQFVNIHSVNTKGKGEQAGKRSKHKHQSSQATKAKGIIQVIGRQVNRQNHAQKVQLKAMRTLAKRSPSTEGNLIITMSALNAKMQKKKKKKKKTAPV